MTFNDLPRLGLALTLVALLAACSGGPNAERSLALAKMHLSQGAPDKAAIELKNALQAEPKMGEARFLLGRLLMDREDPAGAVVELRKAEQAGYDPDQVLPLMAEAYLAAGEPRKAIDLVGAAQLKSAAAVASLKTHAAAAYARLGELDAAQGALKEALAARPDHPAALLLSARAMASRGELEPAGVLVEKLLALDPKDTGALMLKSNLLLAKGDEQGATAELRRVLEIKPGHLDAHAGLLNLMLEKGDEAGAREQLAALKKVRPSHLLTVYQEARLALQQGKLAAADEGAKRLLQANGENTSVLQLAGVVAYRRGETEQAESHLGKLVSLVPHDKPARRLLARTILDRGDAARALETLQPLLGASDADADAGALSIAGEAQLQLGDFKAADRLLARAIKLQPQDLAARTVLAKSKLARGDTSAIGQLESIASADKGDTADLALIAAKVNRREMGAALKAVERLIAKQPKSAQAVNLRGQILARRGDLAAARASFEQALALEKNHFPTIAALTRVDLLENKAADARARLAALVKADPKHAQGLLALAVLDDRAMKPRAEVAALLTQAVTANPKDAGMRVALVDFHLRSREFGSALVAAQSATVALPGDPAVTDALARAQLAAGDANQAAKTFAALALLKPRLPEPLVGLARAQFAADNAQAAVTTARRALDLSPDHEEANRVGAAALVAAGKADEALALARALASRQPVLGHEILGDIERERGRAAEAAAAYQAALRKQPASTALAVRLHGAMIAAGQSAQAQAFAQTWVKDKPKDVLFMVHLSSAAIAANDFGAAQSHLDAALKIDPDLAPALNNLAWLQARTGKAGAVELALRANKLVLNQPTFLDTLAYALAAEGKFGRAIEVQKLALRLGPNDHSLRLGLARLYLQAGDKAAARREVETLERLGSKFAQQAELKELARRL